METRVRSQATNPWRVRDSSGLRLVASRGPIPTSIDGLFLTLRVGLGVIPFATSPHYLSSLTQILRKLIGSLLSP
jgi:hypothetical protein